MKARCVGCDSSMAPSQVKMRKEWPKWERKPFEEHTEMCFSLYQRHVWSPLHLNAPSAVHIYVIFKCCQKSRRGKVNVEVSMLVYTSQGDVASAVSRHPEKQGESQLTFPWCLPGPGGAPEWRNLRPEGWVEPDWWFCWERSWSGEEGWGGE